MDAYKVEIILLTVTSKFLMFNLFSLYNYDIVGDAWSFNNQTPRFVVSPEPFVFVRKLDKEVKCIVLASDGCWDMLDASKAVDVIHSLKVNLGEPFP